MKSFVLLFTLLAFFLNAQAAPLRVFIRGGVKSHGPNAHEHERFLNDWKPMLTQRGITTDGAKDWPTAEQLRATDVLVMYAQDGGNATPEQKANLAEFTQRGGGIVVIHTAVVSDDPVWWKSVIGGAWVQKQTKWKEGPMDLYYVENQRIGAQHPITQGASNFHIDDEIYFDLDLSPDIRVLATSYTPKLPAGKTAPAKSPANVYDIQPQMWTYEKDAYRAFVCIPGHLYDTFEKPFFRAILLRGIAWAGKRPNVDEFCTTEEISSLTYPEGGPQRPAETLKALDIHPDFSMKLIASEPMITKPMNFDWDAAGRMWVAETPEYPNGRRGMRPDYRGKEWKDRGGLDPTPGQQDRKGHDKISILTDTDRDGVADHKDIFYEGLELVTGLVFYKDGVIVTQAPDILWLRDTDRDGKCDKVEKLYTGLGTFDTHAVINNPRWGWDGWIYATHGYSKGDVTSPDGSKKFGSIGSGVVRFKPDGSAIEQYSSKGGNTWGLEITGDNRVMWTQPTSGTLLNQVVLPEYALARGKIGNTASFNTIIADRKSYSAIAENRLPYVQIDRVGDFTAAAGCVIYDGGTWPAEYNGDYFTTEPTINIVHHERLSPARSSFTAAKVQGREETEFIRSTDAWWRPIEVRVGPDGAMYVGDFYNQAVIHNDTRGPHHNAVNAAVRPDRDHYFGRIWRVDHQKAAKSSVPDLSKADIPALIKTLESPNRALRMTASRLLLELPNPVPAGNSWLTAEIEKTARFLEKNFGYQSILKLALDSTKPAESRVAALWILGQRDAEVLMAQWTPALDDANPIVRRNALLLAELPHYAIEKSAETSRSFVVHEDRFRKLLADPDAPVRLAALRALAVSPLSPVSAQALIAAWPKFDDDFQRSAAVGAASQNPALVLTAALDASDPAALAPLVAALTPSLSDAEQAAALVISLAAKPAAVDPLKREILTGLGKLAKSAPAMTPALKSALDTLLAGPLRDTAIPLVIQWDARKGDFTAALGKIAKARQAELIDPNASEATKLAATRSLIDLRATGDGIIPAVLQAVSSNSSPDYQREIIAALSATGDPQVGISLAANFGKLSAPVQAATFETLIQRSEWTLALLDAAKSFDLGTLGPANLARLRTHPDKAVATRANLVLDELMGPALKAKAEIIAKLSADLHQPGDPAKGKALFTAACATCHQYNGEGSNVGPGLTGMGAHGPSVLLEAIVNPNAEVDPSFVAYNIETKDGKFHAGVIARENPTSVVIRSLAGEEEIRTADIKTRTSTGRSLMPEGFESLGSESLRNLLAYLCGSESQKFRTVDLRPVFTADSRKGIYLRADILTDTLNFRKYGTLQVGDVPFNVVAPEKSLNGNNLLVLKGGPSGSLAASMPQRVEAKLGGFTANRLHFLGGVTGWGYQGSGEPSPVMKVTVVYTDGQTEELAFQNGVEFSDYYTRVDVPGSTAVNLLTDHQVRVFSKSLKRSAPIDKLILESSGTHAAPTTAAITAELN